jgi:hypothetical protein
MGVAEGDAGRGAWLPPSWKGLSTHIVKGVTERDEVPKVLGAQL